MGTMLDSTSAPSEVFHGLNVQAIAAYANGRYANAAAAREAYPHAVVLEIDVSGEGVGHAGDFEAGDMPFSEAGTWAHNRIAAGVERPVIYCSVSSWATVSAALHASGLSRHDIRLWTAHYTGQPHLYSKECNSDLAEPADATQWGSADAAKTLPPPYAGRNIDVSETSNTFW